MADQKISQLSELTSVANDDEFIVVDKSDTSMAASGTNKRVQRQNVFDWAESGDLATIEPDDAAAAGSSTEIARADHQHAIAADVPTSLGTWLGGSVGEGSATSFARSDHKHAIPWVGDPQVQLFSVAQYAGPPTSTATGGVNTYYSVPIVVLTPTTLTGIEIRNGATTNGQLRCALYDQIGTRVADRTSDLAQAGSANANRKIPFDSTYAAIPAIYYALVWFSSATATAFMSYVLGTRATTGTNATTTPTGPGTLTVALTVPVLSAY